MSDRKRVKSRIDKFENPEKAENLFEKVKSKAIFDLLIEMLEMLEPVSKRRKAVSKEFKFWFSEDHVCFLYIRPASSHMTIVPAYMDENELSYAAKRNGLTLEVRRDTNPTDQFDAQIRIDENWLDKNQLPKFLSFFQREVIDHLKNQNITTRE